MPISDEFLQDLANQGYKEAAFTYKSNAERYKAVLERRGLEVGIIRSTGPTIESGGNIVPHSYYVIGMEKQGSRRSQDSTVSESSVFDVDRMLGL